MPWTVQLGAKFILKDERNLEHLVLRIESEEKLSQEQIHRALRETLRYFADGLDRGLFSLLIEIGGPGTISRITRTGKVKAIVDER